MKSGLSTYLVGLCFAGQLLAQEPAPPYVIVQDQTPAGRSYKAGADAAAQKSWHEKNRPTDQGEIQ